jgi:hypothetical protein
MERIALAMAAGVVAAAINHCRLPGLSHPSRPDAYEIRRITVAIADSGCRLKAYQSGKPCACRGQQAAPHL